MNCVNCGTPLQQDDFGLWWHAQECPEGTPCYRGDKGPEPDEGILRVARLAQIDMLPPTSDDLALSVIAIILCDPEWAPGMLEDIANIVRATGRTVEPSYVCGPDDEGEPISTWARH